ncbi:OLC1v1015893C1 [Oldenlandia corymbosa var. corymbosa]|uniref:OLC1v1015893C1 n=1 Tax=Oldenlandia corymbosa var. corymbosa TaxID=529605 RepID=A0AAV1E4C9_OLDCO|nr:OLC1v1015893C1 [Oldenlandia corymbosa var. corymbosa]
MDTSILTLTLSMTIFLMIFSCNSSIFPIVKYGCEDQACCGNVSIPFPFGTREDCYLNEKFMIQCRNSTDGVSHPTEPFLGDGNLDVTDITLDGTVEGESKAHNYTTGCKSLCYSRQDVIGDSCSDIGCLQTSIPNEAKFNFSADNLTNIDKDSSVPVLVDWVIAEGVKCEEAKQNTSSYACKSDYSVCEDQKGDMGYRCRCKDGFEGNPYLAVNGCRHIDECEKPSLHNSRKHSSCRNTHGNYTCKCDHGYHGDGTKDEGCTARRNEWPETEKFLPNYFLSSVKSGELGRIFDVKINNSENFEILKEVAMVAEKCISVKGEDRPYMKDVARELEALGIKTQEFIAQALDVIDSAENEALLGINSNKFGTIDSER